MMSTLRMTLILVAVGAQLGASAMSLTLGLVSCTERDGQVAVEVSDNGLWCGATTISAADHRAFLSQATASHCNDCQDVPLQLSEYRASERFHDSAVTAPVALLAGDRFGPPIADAQRRLTWAAMASPPNSSFPRTTILRI